MCRQPGSAREGAEVQHARAACEDQLRESRLRYAEWPRTGEQT